MCSRLRSLVAGLGILVLMSAANAQHWLSVPAHADPMERAHWIWVQPVGTEPPTTGGGVTGRHEFIRRFAAGPGAAKLRFTADNEAVAFINGVEVARSHSWSQVVEADVSRFLQPGTNELRIVAENHDLPGGVNPGGLLAGLSFTNLEGHNVHVLSDATWSSPSGRVVELGPASTPPWGTTFRTSIAPIFRRSFHLTSTPKSARIEVVGLGHYHLWINGRRLGNAALNQPWSQYNKTLYSKTFDLAPYLRKGENVLAVMLGNAFFSVAQPPPGRWSKGDAMPDFGAGFPVRLWIRGIVETDDRWRWLEGPVTLSHIFAGEDYDARRLPAGWNLPGFDDATWSPPEVIPAPRAKIVPQDWPDVKAHEVFRPIKIHPAPKGGWTYRFAQNCSAMLRFRVKGPAGSTVRFKLSEVVQDDGQVEQLNLWNATALTSYTLRGGASETHENLFFYHGGQFVGVEGAVPAGKPNPDGLPVLESLELVHVRTANSAASSIETSSDLINRTVRLIDWAMRSNMSFVMSDCPHREKLGWLECAHLLANSFAYRYDCKAWFHKICRDMRDAQLPSGRVLTVAPLYLMRPEDDMYAWTVEWGAASVMLPWYAYTWYGDRSFLTENFAMMKAFVDHVRAESKDLIAPGSLGDWYDYGHGQPPGPSRYTDTRLTATAVFAQCARAVADAAEVLDMQAEAAAYRQLHQEIAAAFKREFWRAEEGGFAHRGSVQTAHAIALVSGLVSKEDAPAVLNAILRELRARDYQQTSGDVGHLYFIRALASAGRSDVLHRVYSRTGLGSYGGILAKGLTTLPETWDAITVGSNSLNHCMLGHAMEWFYGYVLGVRQAEGSVGWKTIVIDPSPGALTHARGHVDTPLGRVNVAWRRSGPNLTIQFSVPPGATAECDGKSFGPGDHRVTRRLPAPSATLLE